MYVISLLKLIDRSESECFISYRGFCPCIISFQSDELGEYNFEGRDLFEAVCHCRRFLEARGFNLLCNGARIDAYPSGMSRDMCGGMKLHVLKFGQSRDRRDLVIIFDRAEPNQVGTVAEQRNYYKKWLDNFN